MSVDSQAQAPKDAAEIAAKVRARFPEAVLSGTSFRGEETLSLKLDALHEVAKFCRDGLDFDYLVDISSLDHLGEDPRFELVYELYAMETGVHLRLKALIPGDVDPVGPSVTDLWPTADWHEREIYDMMGIRFDGHPNLCRILMWEGYPFHPLRKDFPLEGKPSEVAEVAFTAAAPLAGGPFVTVPTNGITDVREPRARRAGDEPPPGKFLAES
jgi:NADH-quinone oxidoreductase subunit C